ncbi:GAF and ANTAR domain-containing protein [Streptomyces sp. NPDC051561]|uniref:GAF and ANTAR domain-containing protein n=1 Tax=Streptomyces sp. NPDC051561 TaxID=3365658 RepID=UPI0037A3983B
MGRVQHWMDASVHLAELMLTETDVREFLREFCTRSVGLLDTVAVGAMLADENGVLRVAAASDERSALLELLAAQRQEGPCVDGYRSGEPEYDIDLRAAADRWPVFCSRALKQGIDRTSVLPLRRQEERLGTWQVYGHDKLPERQELELAQRLADITVLSLSHSKDLWHLSRSADELRSALTSRVAIEQAKGMLAAQWGVHPDVAFQPLRAYARSHRRRLREVALDIVEGRLQLPPDEGQ